MKFIRRARDLAVISLLAAAATTAAAAQAGGNPLADHVRQANARFQNIRQATAEGYAPIPCTSGVDGGAMGVHYVNMQLIQSGKVDIAHPQAVLYEPGPDGQMRLVAVEYVSLNGPASLDGQLFSYQGAPNRYGLPAFYELHVWAWKPNPKGAFTDFNPTVTCEHVH